MIHSIMRYDIFRVKKVLKGMVLGFKMLKRGL